MNFSLGKNVFHSGLIFIFWFSSWYWIMPWLDRERDNSISFSMATSSWSASSLRLCHAPSLMVSKNSSLLKVIHQFLLMLFVFKFGRTLGIALVGFGFCILQTDFYRTKCSLL